MIKNQLNVGTLTNLFFNHFLAYFFSLQNSRHFFQKPQKVVKVRVKITNPVVGGC